MKYRIKFLLNSHTAKVLDIQDCVNHKQVLEFNNLHCNTRKIQAFCSNIGEITKFPILFLIYLIVDDNVYDTLPYNLIFVKIKNKII
jgi:hypothetical protein